MRVQTVVSRTIAILCTITSGVFSHSATAGRTLVVGDASIIESDEYSEFFSGLKSLAGDGGVEYKAVDDESVELLAFESELNYDLLVLLPVKPKSLGPRLTSKKLLNYFEKGGNVLAVTTPTSVPESLREFASQLDIFISPRGYELTDHFVGKGEKDREIQIGTDNWSSESSVITSPSELSFNGNGAYLGNSELVIPILKAPKTSYIYDAREDDDYMGVPWVQGNQISLAAALQSLSNSRFSWVGDIDLLKNSASESARLFVKDLASWTGQEKGVIKAYGVENYIVNASSIEYQNDKKLFEMKKDVHYEITFSQWNGEKWGPYEANDIQLEYVMLDPYYRINLEKIRDNTDSTIYGTTFKTADQYGMFTFKVDYKRTGLSFVEEREIVTVRHTANDEWPRSWEITNSWIYFASSTTVITGWLLFVIFYLYSSEK